MPDDMSVVNALSEELLDGIENGDFDDVTRIPEKYSYAHLQAMYYRQMILENGASIYNSLYTIIMRGAEYHIKETAKIRKLRIAFLSYSAAEWQAESVYRTLKKDDRLEVYIVVAPLTDRDLESKNKTYQETYDYYSTNGYDARGTYDPAGERELGWEETGGIPDIIIHLAPWFGAIPKKLQMTQLPLRCINIYIPYAMVIPENAEKTYTEQYVCDTAFSAMMWCIFTDSKLTAKEYRTKALLQDRNVVYSGFPKMDYFYERQDQASGEEAGDVWKIPHQKRKEDVKKVIIAPHHSMNANQPLQFSTFRHNAHFFQEMAKKYEEQISFVFKPHPNVRYLAVASGIFPDYAAYDQYIADWENMPNARVVTESSYLDLFASSDAIIMDSCSFIGEYLYADKPSLFLTREGQAFTPFGTRLMEAHYQVRGDDLPAIEAFLQKNVLGSEDPKAGRRKRVFSECLDYRAANRMKAGDQICRRINSLL